MKTEDIISPKSITGFGVITAFGLIAYFMLMRSLGLIHYVELRYVNFFVLLAGILASMRHKVKQQGGFTYLEGFSQGVVTGGTAAILFGIFINLYLHIDKGFMTYLQENAMFGSYLTPQTAFGVVIAEGSASAVIISYIAMQYFKRYTVAN